MFKKKIEYWIYLLFAAVFQILGINITRRIAFIFATLFCYIIPIRKKVVIKNLKMAFPEKNDDEISALTYKVYKNAAIVLLEIFCIPALSKDKLIEQVILTDLSAVNEKIKLDKGLFILTAHFGNWEIGAILFPLFAGKPGTGIIKKLSNPYVDKWIDNMRTMHGNKTVPLGLSIKDILIAIKEKKIVGMLADQRAPKESPRVKFFGHDTAVFTGGASIIQKTEVPVFFFLLVRTNNYKYQLIVEEIVIDPALTDSKDKVMDFTQKYFSLLEKYIKLYPDQWFWMHNIWKY